MIHHYYCITLLNQMLCLEDIHGQSGDIHTGQGGPGCPDSQLFLSHRGRGTHCGHQEV